MIELSPKLPHAERSEDHFRIASELRPLLEVMDAIGVWASLAVHH